MINEEDDALCVETARRLIINYKLPLDLICVSSNFGFLATKLKELENPNLSLHESLFILDGVKKKIDESVGPRAEIVKTKISKVLENNLGLDFMRQAYQILNGSIIEPNNLVTNKLKPSEITALKFAPLTSCDVERSFSVYKNILTDRRTNFTIQNLEMYFVSNFYLNRQNVTLEKEELTDTK